MCARPYLAVSSSLCTASTLSSLPRRRYACWCAVGYRTQLIFSSTQDPNRPPHAYELLNAYGIMRGFMNARGQPDGPRSARILLKDYVRVCLLSGRACANLDMTGNGCRRGSCCMLRHPQAHSLLHPRWWCILRVWSKQPLWVTRAMSEGPRCSDCHPGLPSTSHSQHTLCSMLRGMSTWSIRSSLQRTTSARYTSFNTFFFCFRELFLPQVSVGAHGVSNFTRAPNPLAPAGPPAQGHVGFSCP